MSDKTKKNKKVALFIIFLAIVLIVVGAIMQITNKDEKDKDNKEEETVSEDDKEDDATKETPVDSTSSVSGKQYEKGYDGYTINKVDNDYYLMRNQKEITKLNKNDKIKIYKDESDEKSKYIAVTIYNDEFSFGQVWKDNEYAIGMYVATENNNPVVTSVLYSTSNGRSANFDGIVVPIEIGIDEKVSDEYYALSSDDGLNLIRVSDFKVIKGDYSIVGDDNRLSVDEPIFASSKDFIVAYKIVNENIKYGLVDYNGKILIDFVYDDLVTFCSNEKILLAKKNGKFGAIDLNGKTIINFEYDGIDYENGNYAILKGNKLGVLDKNGKEIVPAKIEVANKKFSLKLCCGNNNSYGIVKNDDKELVVAYLDNNKKRKQADNDDYEYQYSYLVVTKNGQYSTHDNYGNYNDDDWYS